VSDIAKWELLGIPVIFILGFILHEAYDISGKNPIVALIAPVNESVWEHLKMAASAVFIFAFLEYFFIGRFSPNFILGKTLSILTVPLLIMVLHYGYKIITGTHVLFLDILILLVAIIVGQMLSYFILNMPQKYLFLNEIALVLSVIIISGFFYYTYYPPQMPVFMDSTTGKYGIIRF